MACGARGTPHVDDCNFGTGPSRSLGPPRLYSSHRGGPNPRFVRVFNDIIFSTYPRVAPLSMRSRLWIDRLGISISKDA